MFLEQIGESLVGQFLEVPHAVPTEQVESVPGFLIELYTLAGHLGILLRDNPATPWQFPQGQTSR